jgi:hypothetical protein
MSEQSNPDTWRISPFESGLPLCSAVYWSVFPHYFFYTQFVNKIQKTSSKRHTPQQLGPLKILILAAIVLMCSMKITL